ncbi:MAG TPA: carbohydrate kinase family protein [Candidatus Limnocylindrales bacterium]
MTGRPEFDVVVGGSWYADLIFTGLAVPPRLGAEIWARDFAMTPGGTFNVVAAMHRLGLRVGWSTVFGNDLFSAFLLGEARAERLDERLFRMADRPRRVVTASFSMPHERGFVSFEEWPDDLGDVELIRRNAARCYFASGDFPHPRPEDVRRALETRQAIYVLDPQFTTATLDLPMVVETLELADVFVPNESEAVQLTGASTAEDALEILGRHTDLVVIKRGPRGAIASHRGVRLEAPARACDSLDTTGAGDCFNAGLIAGLLAGDSLEDALRQANACAAQSTTAPGVTAAPDLEQVRRLLARPDASRPRSTRTRS